MGRKGNVTARLARPNPDVVVVQETESPTGLVFAALRADGVIPAVRGA
jgi:hypothetical protein